MTKNDKKNFKILKKNILLANQPIFFLVHLVISYGNDLGREMASGCDRGLSRTQKRLKKELKLNCFTHTQKIMKNNENFSS